MKIGAKIKNVVNAIFKNIKNNLWVKGKKLPLTTNQTSKYLGKSTRKSTKYPACLVEI